MHSRDGAGGPPDSSGAETRRPAANHRPAAGTGASRSPRPASPTLSRLFSRRRFRLQAAGLAALGLIALTVLVLVPERRVRVVVDGDVTTVSSRSASDVSVVEQAGVELKAGDRVEEAPGDTLAVRRAAEGTLSVDGQTYAVRTQAERIDEVLAEAEVSLEPEDSVLLDGRFVSAEAPVAPVAALASSSGGPATEAPPAEPLALEVRRAVPFMVIENGQTLDVRSSRETLATALRDVGVRLGPGDRTTPPPHAELTAGLEVHVEHALSVVVTRPEGKLLLYSLAETVGEALAEGGVALPARYRLEPPAETPLAPGMAIHIVGISEEEELEEERIESRTLYQADPSLPYGERRVVQGHDGVRYRQYQAVYEDGRLISRELASEWYAPEPQDTIVYYSTRTAPPPPPTPARSLPVEAPPGLNVARTLRVYATWYNATSAGRSPSDPWYGITATGVRVDRGVIAVDPSVIPLGTRLYVPGYGYGVAADTGGGISGDMIDLGYPDGVVPDWVSRWVDIYILE